MANIEVCDVTGIELVKNSNCSTCPGGRKQEVKDKGYKLSIRPIDPKDKRGRHDIALCSKYADKLFKWLQDEYKKENPED